MADRSAQSEQPHYISLDEKGQEQFLSDLGTFSPDERECFHRLCKIWRREIPYNIASEGSPSGQNTVDRLLDKLRKRGYGLIRTTGYGQDRHGSAVILTARYDEHFSQALLEEELSHFFERDSRQFPTEATLVQNGVQIPADYIETINYGQLARIYENAGSAPRIILRLPGLSGCTHLVTAATGRPFVQAAIDRVRRDCLREEPLEFIARLRDSTLGDTRHLVLSRDPVAWSKLTSLIIEKRPLIDAKRNILLDDGFYQACYVVGEFIRNQIIQAREKKRADEERHADFAAIARTVKEHKPSLLTPKQLTDMVMRVKAKYGDQFDEFSREFYDTVLSPPPAQKRSLPVICRIGTAYIHRDLLFGEFRAHSATASAQLYEEYIKRMAYQLRYRSRTVDDAFISRDNFEIDIDHRLAELDPFLHELLQNPTFFAEVVIHNLKQGKGPVPIQEVKAALSFYLDVDAGTFHPPSNLFNLDMVTIFEQAFLRLSVLRQLFIRVAGRYETYKRKYVGRTQQRPSRRRRFRDSEEYGTDPGMIGPTARKIAAETEATGNRTAGTYPRSRTRSSERERKPKPPKKRTYSQRERDAAWEAFNKTLHE